ncbi:glycosyltransferase [Paraglaciecola chathamensis]|uniref:Glycosyltransferase n=1 Tax=Paraglaciecola chathamensis TaxID=368405 RepID=A0ABS0W8H9_9ALTE|nr:glycosyltransferase family 2 protein [Paraglaciecola chathamensis]MBJ2135076.1 glycosyltransferase [Paraglaciecola chathamensis]
MTSTKVSICLAYYNRSEYVQDCIESLLKQNYPNFEVVVVNDGSTDPDTAVMLDAFEDPRLKVVHQKNTGFVTAISNAIAVSTGEYIAIMGAGDVCHPMRIKMQAATLDSDEKIGLVGCLYENVIFGGADDGRREKRVYSDKDISAKEFLSGPNPLGHGEAMYRRSVYEQAGGYRTFFKFSQDLDLWLRMVDYCNVKVLQEFLYERRMFTADGVSTDPKKLFLQKYLAQFARQSYFDRKELGYDYVERYGIHAGFFKKPSEALTRYTHWYCTKALKQKDYASAKYFFNLAKYEVKSLRFYLVSVLMLMSKYKLGQTLLSVILKFKR